jgi:aminomethyltransferase
VPIEYSYLGTNVKVAIRDQGVKAMVVPTPFYKRQKKAA